MPDHIKSEPLAEEIDFVVKALEEAERPLILAGNGVRMAAAGERLAAFVEKYGIPIGGTRLGWDIYPNTKPLHVGVIDSRGNRAANFALGNADVVLVLGSRLGIRTSGYNYDLFARAANKVIVVDINESEHKKQTVRIDRLIVADVKRFLDAIPELHIINNLSGWQKACMRWKEKWPTFVPAHEDDSHGISAFAFCKELNGHLQDESIIVTSAGTPADIVMQSLRFSSRKQRYLGGDAQCEMGNELPAAIGASIAGGKKEVVCIVGDGSLQMNIQELQTMVTQQLPVRVFVWNNGGYASIRGHQRTVFHGRFLGVDPASGTCFPNLEKIADAYGIPYLCAEKLDELPQMMKAAMHTGGAVICEIMCWMDDPFPMAKGKLPREDGVRVPVPMEDMAPLLEREEFEQEMLAPLYRWWKV